MSFGGILAQALAGGAGAIRDQATGDIDKQRRLDIAAQSAAIEEQTQTRLAELRARLSRQSNKDQLTDTLAFNSSDDTIAANSKVARAAGATARDVERERLGDTGLNEAARKKAADDAKASAEAASGILKSQAADPVHLKSITVLKLADPEVRARIAQAGAAAGASAAETKMRGEQLKQLQAVGEVATKVRGLQDSLAKATDPAQRQAVEQQITDLGFSGKDIKSFLSTAERAMTNGDTAMRVLLSDLADPAAKEAARTQLERANEFAVKAAGLAGIKLDAAPAGKGAPAAGAEVNGYVFKGGDPNDKKNWTPKAAAKPSAGKGEDKGAKSGGILASLDGAMNENAQLGYQMEAVRAKVRAGQPLTATEQEVATRYGIR